jgi:hypothetical protein
MKLCGEKTKVLLTPCSNHAGGLQEEMEAEIKNAKIRCGNIQHLQT